MKSNADDTFKTEKKNIFNTKSQNQIQVARKDKNCLYQTFLNKRF